MGRWCYVSYIPCCLHIYESVVVGINLNGGVGEWWLWGMGRICLPTQRVCTYPDQNAEVRDASCLVVAVYVDAETMN